MIRLLALLSCLAYAAPLAAQGAVGTARASKLDDAIAAALARESSPKRALR